MCRLVLIALLLATWLYMAVPPPPQASKLLRMWNGRRDPGRFRHRGMTITLPTCIGSVLGTIIPKLPDSATFPAV